MSDNTSLLLTIAVVCASLTTCFGISRCTPESAQQRADHFTCVQTDGGPGHTFCTRDP